MQRRLLIQRVMTELGSATEHVAYPDHPLLLRGPDVLALTRGVLTAYFVYNGRGPRPTSGQEQTRFLLTRLALPPGTRCVLVIDPVTTVNFSPTDILLDEVLVLGDVRAFSRATSQFDVTDAGEVIEGVRAFHHARFAEAWTRAFEVPEDLRLRSETPGQPTSEAAAERSPPRRLRWMGIDNGVIYARPRARTAPELRRVVASTTVATTSLDYDLSLGLSGVAATSAKLRSGNGHLAIHHLFHERAYLWSGFDAFKPQRTAAFAGIEADGFQVST